MIVWNNAVVFPALEIQLLTKCRAKRPLRPTWKSQFVRELFHCTETDRDTFQKIRVTVNSTLGFCKSSIKGCVKAARRSVECRDSSLYPGVKHTEIVTHFELANIFLFVVKGHVLNNILMTKISTVK